MMDEKSANAVIMISTVALSVFASHLPDVKDLRSADSDNPQALADLRIGQMFAGMSVISVGAVASIVLGKYEPLAFSVGVVLVLCIMYESLLRSQLGTSTFGQLRLVQTG